MLVGVFNYIHLYKYAKINNWLALLHGLGYCFWRMAKTMFI